MVVVLANIIQGIISLVSGGGSSAAESVGTAPLVGGAIFAFVLAVIELIIVFKMRDGRNWARIVLLVLAILQVIGVGVGAASRRQRLRLDRCRRGDRRDRAHVRRWRERLLPPPLTTRIRVTT